MNELSFDAIVAGGGIAGSTTAAALAAQGLEVLLCEAGLPSDKRLAGELMHPPAAQRLEDLGLLHVLEKAGGVPVHGFAVFTGGDAAEAILHYGEVPGSRKTGLAVEHADLTRALLAEVATRPHVTFWDGARVLEMQAEALSPTARIRYQGVEHSVRAQLFVSAEGRGSGLRERAGIEVERGDSAQMVGYRVHGGRLPHRGFGHVFAGGPASALAYQVAEDEVRVMFELPEGQSFDAEAYLAVLPRPFRDDVRRAIAETKRQTSRIYALTPLQTTRGRLAVVGDAGGCVHPLTASGMAFCTADAVRLAEEVGTGLRRGEDIQQALARYQRGRRGPMRTRATLGPALVEALSSHAPEMELLRRGLFRYWSKSSRGRGASLGLLSTQEARGWVMLREYAAVCMHAVLAEGRRIDLNAAVALAGRSTEQLGRLLDLPGRFAA